jgi:FKBP-type peptidyl-prolyl cis-trans isomerase SlyD
MENKKNKYVAVSYKLYTTDADGRHLVEETKEGQPFSFISGFGFALDKFEEIITNTPQGYDFSFTLPKEDAYGEYHDEYVLDLDREMFCINGHFDHEHIYKDAIVPLQNEEGNRFNGRVVEVSEEKVKIDLNHPLAGEALYFEGNILENRDATEEEISHLMKHLTGGCGCGCDDCGGHCEDGCEGHDHHDGCGCGHCH